MQLCRSISENLPPEEYQQKYKELLSDFDEILVREDYGADIVENLTEKRPEVVCDPTVLLTAEEWISFWSEPYKENTFWFTSWELTKKS